jgi:hypothetical protein
VRFTKASPAETMEKGTGEKIVNADNEAKFFQSGYTSR